MFFISPKKFFSFLSMNVSNFSIPFRTFQIQKDKWKWTNLYCHALA